MKNPVFPLIVFLLLAFAGCSSPSGGGGNPPSAPGGFRLSKIADGEIELSWDTASGATEYEVLIGTTNDASSATSLGTVSTASFTVDTTNYSGLTNGTEYYFWVRANNSNGSSPLSAALTGTPMALVPIITGMSPQAVTGAEIGSLSISWTKTSTADSYKVYVSTTTSRPGTATVELAGNVSECDLTGLNIGVTYNIWVSASNDNGESIPSSYVSAATTPPKPTGVSAVFEIGAGTVIASWNLLVSTETIRYDVYCGNAETTSNGTVPPAATSVTGVDGTSAEITGLAEGKIYYVWVKTKIGSAPSDYSDAAEASSIAARPTGLSAANPTPGLSADGKLNLSWTSSPTTDLDRYDIYYSTSATAPTGGTSPTTSAADTDTAKQLSSLTPNTSYYVWMRAVKSGEPGLWIGINRRVYNNQASISPFSISGTAGVISGNTITVTMPLNSTVTSVTPVIGKSDGASISPAVGATNFTTSQSYTVTSEDGTASASYTVYVYIRATDAIQYTAPGDETIDLSGQSIPWTDNGMILVNAPASPAYDSYAWFVDNVPHTGAYLSDGGKTLNKPLAELPPGNHTITLRVLKGSIPYTKLVTLTISIPE
jgi:hypothetical protein